MNLLVSLISLVLVSTLAAGSSSPRGDTLQAIARARAVEQLALQEGLISEARSFPELIKEFHEENRRRSEMKERGEVFYGPVRFRKEVWFEIRQQQLVKALEKRVISTLADFLTRSQREAIAREQVEQRIQALAAHLNSREPSTASSP